MKELLMSDASKVAEIIFGRWRSQVLYTGAALGVFDHLSRETARSAVEVAPEVRSDPAMLYRLLRALASIGLIDQEKDRFRLNAMGELLRDDSTRSMRYIALLEEGPEHYAIWRHLADMVRTGKQNGFAREFGAKAFEYAETNASYNTIFNRAMSNFSSVQSALAIEALRNYNFKEARLLCDIAGGHGHLLCSLLKVHEHATGIVLDLPDVVDDVQDLWAPKMGVENRCNYIGGNMFEDVPTADAYFLKMILHDWSDEECVAILSNIRRRTNSRGRVFIVEHVVPESGEAHFSKLYDIHMMCWGTGRERTAAEYAGLLKSSGWTAAAVHYPDSRMMGVVEGAAS
jgi:hypothetical protein